MKRFNWFLFLILLLKTLSVNAQDTLNQSYFNELRGILQKDPNVKSLKLVQKKSDKGKSIVQTMYVKFHDDPTNRYWSIGKSFVNGEWR